MLRRTFNWLQPGFLLAVLVSCILLTSGCGDLFTSNANNAEAQQSEARTMETLLIAPGALEFRSSAEQPAFDIKDGVFTIVYTMRSETTVVAEGSRITLQAGDTVIEQLISDQATRVSIFRDTL